MTDDVISRKAAIDAVCTSSGTGTALKALKALPSAQPEIIKCKNCKYWLDIDDGRQKHRMCADVYGDWFCADAERREE